jgi:mRNA interferase MazF
MLKLEQGDIVLVPVPFTDLSSTRKRPLIVISNDGYHKTAQDIIIVAMTSNPAQTTYSFVLTSNDLSSGSLNRPGTVRADRVYTLARKIAVRVFGRVNATVLERIRGLLDQITKP